MIQPKSSTPPAVIQERSHDEPSTQARWLRGARGRKIRCRLIDGKTVVGLLINFDRYTLELRPTGATDSLLVQKHAIAYCAIGRDLGAGE